MREVCFILTGDAILRAFYGTESKIPDSAERWRVIWEHREDITEITHTHPGNLLEFSSEDETTMEAVEAGTGRAFAWSIVTADGYLLRRNGLTRRIEAESEIPWWLDMLRELSFGPDKSSKKSVGIEKHDSSNDILRSPGEDPEKPREEA